MKIIDGPRYVVVVDSHLGILYRVRKRRIGLMRFGSEPRYQGGDASGSLAVPRPGDTKEDDYCDTCLMGGCPIHEQPAPMNERNPK